MPFSAMAETNVFKILSEFRVETKLRKEKFGAFPVCLRFFRFRLRYRQCQCQCQCYRYRQRQCYRYFITNTSASRIAGNFSRKAFSLVSEMAVCPMPVWPSGRRLITFP